MPARVLHVRVLTLAGASARAADPLAALRRDAPRATAETDLRLAMSADDRRAAVVPARLLSERYGGAQPILDAVGAWARGEAYLPALEAGLDELWQPRRRLTPRLVNSLIQMAVELFALAGQPERALDVLERATATLPPFVDLLWLDAAHSLAPLRASPRFAAARAQMALRAAAILA